MAGNSRRQRRDTQDPAPRRAPPSARAASVAAGWRAAGRHRPRIMRPNHPAAKRAAKPPQRRPAKRTDEAETVLRPQPGAGMPARRCPGDRALRRARHRSRRAAHRIRHPRGRSGHRDPRGAAHRTGPDDHQPPAPGHRAAGAAVRLRPPRRSARGRHAARRRRCWSRWTTSPIPATSARSFVRSPRSAATAC